MPEVGSLALSSSLQLVESHEKSRRSAPEWQLSSLSPGYIGRDLGNTYQFRKLFPCKSSVSQKYIFWEKDTWYKRIVQMLSGNDWQQLHYSSRDNCKNSHLPLLQLLNIPLGMLPIALDKYYQIVSQCYLPRSLQLILVWSGRQTPGIWVPPKISCGIIKPLQLSVLCSSRNLPLYMVYTFLW